MKRNRISAGILLAVGILVLLYTGSYGMFCVLAAVLFLLLCLAIYTVLAGRNLAGYIQLPENGEKKARISGKICIYNHSILPLFCVGCDLYWANRLTGEKGKEKILFGIAGKKTEEIQFSFETVYSGECTVQAQTLECMDSLRIFRRKIPVSMYGATVILPEIYDAREEITHSESYNMESFRYSQEHGGEDAGETFQVREYEAGDSMKQIHWKLSARLNDLVVREPGYPVTRSVLVFLETGYEGSFPDPEYLDRQASVALSVTDALLRQGITCQLGFYDFALNRVFQENIQDMESFWQAAVLVVRAGRQENGVSGLRRFLENCEEWQAGHYIYVTAKEAAKEVVLLQESAEVTILNGEDNSQA